jgi:hypothetical protein
MKDLEWRPAGLAFEGNPGWCVLPPSLKLNGRVADTPIDHSYAWKG